jgi:hypothetical protein
MDYKNLGAEVRTLKDWNPSLRVAILSLFCRYESMLLVVMDRNTKESISMFVRSYGSKLMVGYKVDI